ncbi:MAG: hypothetical protein MSH49_04220 [[Eubacterium] saphenum]|nr:hypothetical protein [[Eubacterium] saphenum]
MPHFVAFHQAAIFRDSTNRAVLNYFSGIHQAAFLTAFSRQLDRAAQFAAICKAISRIAPLFHAICTAIRRPFRAEERGVGQLDKQIPAAI